MAVNVGCTVTVGAGGSVREGETMAVGGALIWPEPTLSDCVGGGGGVSSSEQAANNTTIATMTAKSRKLDLFIVGCHP
jgi:hypothetical protein